MQTFVLESGEDAGIPPLSDEPAPSPGDVMETVRETLAFGEVIRRRVTQWSVIDVRDDQIVVRPAS